MRLSNIINKALFERAMNILSGLLIIYIVIIVGNRYVFKASSAPVGFDAKFEPGQPVKMAGIAWPRDKGTLVVALQVGCKYCAKNMPFYRALTTELETTPKWHVMAVLPQPVSQSSIYLTKNKVRFPNVHQLNLQEIGVSGTPTILLVDTAGRLIQSWAGALDSKGEQDVASHLGITLPNRNSEDESARGGTAENSAGAGPDPIVYTSELLGLMRSGSSLQIVDVRARKSFIDGHIKGAYSIPADELVVRLPHELDVTKPILVYCGYSEYCAINSMGSLCQHAESEFLSAHVPMRTIRDKLPELTAAGVFMETANQAWAFR